MTLQKKARTVICAVILIFLLFTHAWLARNYAQSQRFGDEIGNMVAGHLVTKGYTLYKDVQLNHQPLVYLFSAFVDRISNPSNLFLFIQRQREALFLYAALWNVLFVFLFGPVTLPFIALFELIKYENAGYKLLGETLAVYPSILMVGLAAKALFIKEKMKNTFLAVFSASSFIAVFSLSPLWPALLALNIVLLLRVKNNLKNILFVCIPQVMLIFILFLFIPFGDYVRETIIYTVQYLLPVLDKVNTLDGYAKMFFLPLTSLFSLSQSKSQIILIFLLLYGIATYRFLKKKKMILWIIMIGIISLTNTRADRLDNNFHLLPWLGVYLFLGIYLVLKIHNNHTHRALYYCFIFLLSLIPCMYARNTLLLFRRQNRLTEHQISYVESQRNGAAVAAVKDRDDRLIALPYDPLVYYVADMRPTTHVLEYYSWIYDIPRYRRELEETFQKNPPPFVVDAGLDEDHPVDRFVLSRLKKEYVRALHQNTLSPVYILKKKIPEITKAQWTHFNDLLFTVSQRQNNPL